MDEEARKLLREIGLLLDQNQFPRVYNGGIVMPGETAVPPKILGKECEHVRQRQRRPAARSRQGTTRRQGPPHRSGASGRAAPLICASLQKQYEADIDAVLEAYPGTQKWHQTGGLWLLTESAILPGLGKKATFLTALPYNPKLTVESWGYWTTAKSAKWIGPRHTNFPAGSICAFEPQDGTWINGCSICSVLDLYSVWALRHLHLEEFGRWPGRQAVHHSYERLTELRDDEFCGCDKSDKLYGDCCKKRDLAKDQNAIELDFSLTHPNCGLREPPEAISAFVGHRAAPLPTIAVLT